MTSAGVSDFVKHIPFTSRIPRATRLHLLHQQLSTSLSVSIPFEQHIELTTSLSVGRGICFHLPSSISPGRLLDDRPAPTRSLQASVSGFLQFWAPRHVLAANELAFRNVAGPERAVRVVS